VREVRVLRPVRGGPIVVIDDRPQSVGVWEIRVEEDDFEKQPVEIIARGLFGRVERPRGYDDLAELFGPKAARSVTSLLGEISGQPIDREPNEEETDGRQGQRTTG